ncbi:hypothetical protein [Streptomyces fragilis]|uniref:Translation initiation factor IF-2 n=1 Tax=Streptomyces fragilis TaxID=67301 RepID=A0ABV2YMY6_9ACTN|nr:hypothetical protein [Streptomyces fragilis]
MGGHDDKYYDEQIKGDIQEVKESAQVIDVVNKLEQVLGGILPGAGGRFFGRTNFEGHRLNDMIDMVEPANPEQVEEVGTSLLKASKAIDEAAEQLRVDIAKVDWEGESAEAFETWSSNLVTKAKSLATYSENVGQQITLAGSGLASVRKSMPPRDAREDPKSVSEIPAAKRVETNEEYVAAVKAEQHRQEAINQMIRLSSFYAVSEEALAGQEPPTFDPMPHVAVPAPQPAEWQGGEQRGQSGRVGYAGDPTVAGGRGSAADVAPVTARIDGSAAGDVPQVQPVGSGSMQIDSVATATPPQETTRPSSPSPATGPAATTIPVPPTTGNVGPITAVGRGGGPNARQMPISAQGQASRSVTGAGGKGTGPAVGRSPMQPVGPTGQQATGRAGGGGARGPVGPAGQQATGRAGGARGPVGPVGQQAATGRAGGGGARGPVGSMGQQAAAGRAGGAGARGSVGPMGQTQPVTGRQANSRSAGRVTGATPAPHGVAGGVPRANAPIGGQGSGRPVQSGAAATGGVVGGRPTGTTPNGPNGTRVPRGTVIGGSDGVTRGAGEQPGRRGVVGASGTPTAGAARPVQRPTTVPGGVVGAPSGAVSRRNRDKKRSTDADRRNTPPTNG